MYGVETKRFISIADIPDFSIALLTIREFKHFSDFWKIAKVFNCSRTKFGAIIVVVCLVDTQY